ncbi:MAG: hypothetical protein JNL83_22980 [Myxococcales bacterium]|nr:hypothetical protein [Myxococcales bacterium]
MSHLTHIPKSVIDFVQTYVDDVVELRLLVTLHGAPDGTQTVQRIALDLDLPAAQVRDAADDLVGDGLIRASSDQLQLAPSSISDRLALADLAGLYAADRAAVLGLLAAIRGQA